ncbi:MAG: C45 family peptidase [Desulfovibrio sp.]|jgi:isopenicillin-N N-acyltransferase-like protein|nr:C45 family peptidase [Desulfovibrio sp.]
MAAMAKSLPIVDLEGSPYAMGLRHGQALREAVHAFLEGITEVHRNNNAFIQTDRETLIGFCLRNLSFVRNHSPDLYAEMQGIADGAGLSLEEVLYLNSFLELEDLRASSLGGRLLHAPLWGCTTFSVTAEGGADGRAFLGQTYDMEKYYEQFLCLLRLRPEKGPSQLVVSLPGVLGLVGMNSVGTGLVINKVVATDAAPGLVYPCIVRRALAAGRIGDSLGAVIFSPRATGMTYQLAGGGAAFCAETSAARYELLEIDGVFAHTNHWLGESMRRFETAGWLSHGGSMVRKQVADKYLRARRGTLTPDMLRELTRDHTNYPRCICAHGFPDEDETRAFHSIFAVIMEPAAGRFEFCLGNPCENTYDAYALP